MPQEGILEQKSVQVESVVDNQKANIELKQDEVGSNGDAKPIGGEKKEQSTTNAAAQAQKSEERMSEGFKPRGRGPPRQFRQYPYGGRYIPEQRIRPYFEGELIRWEEGMKEKKILKENITGHVKFFSFRKNYGFIERNDDHQTVFVHQLAIKKSRTRQPHLRTLEDGEEVQFDVAQGTRGLEAVNVTGINGTDVQGCRIIFVPVDPYYPRSPIYNNRYRQSREDRFQRGGPPRRFRDSKFNIQDRQKNDTRQQQANGSNNAQSGKQLPMHRQFYRHHNTRRNNKRFEQKDQKQQDNDKASNVITADENKKPADDKTEIEEKKMSDGDDMKTQDELVKEVATIEIKN